MKNERQYSFLDQICLFFDQTVRALSNNPKTSGEAYPAARVKDEPLSEAARQQSAALMRVNHAGEVCAQGLYHGQAMISRNPAIQAKFKQAAEEEGDHLAWCKQRLDELKKPP